MDETFRPAYSRLGQEILEQRARQARELLRDCSVCPRACGVDRTAGVCGYCGIEDRPFISSYGPHFGEESPLVGTGGSGTIFMGGCNLGCLFCQNWTISHEREGHYIDEDALAAIMLGLERAGCHNINIVTPTHQMPMVLGALSIAADRGLELPLVYNCGGYESLEALELLDGVVDIYMPDLKYMDGEVSKRLSDAPDYPEAAKASLREMHRQVGILKMDNRAIAQRGLIVRHLVLPGGLAGTGEAMRFLAQELSPDTYVNIMDQYRPCYRAGEFPEINRRPTHKEYEEAVALARKAGLHRFA
ncbi:MAG: radical SAM protein [Thermodesulfovibrionales bacterium]|nr:radical SAM protein [Thermodesulfovibrionales bacterium]